MSVKEKWLAVGFLASGLFLFGSASPARAQNAAPDELPPRSAADQQEDRSEAARLREQTLADRERLRADLRAFGPRSPQVQADREQLRRDRGAMRRLKRDRRRDRRIRRHHSFDRDKD